MLTPLANESWDGRRRRMFIWKKYEPSVSCPTERAKRCIDAKINTLEFEGNCSPSFEK